MRFEDSEIERYSVSKGDLVICEGGEPGRCAVWEDEEQGFLIQKALHRMKLLNNLTSPQFIYHYIKFIEAGTVIVCTVMISIVLDRYIGRQIESLRNRNRNLS